MAKTFMQMVAEVPAVSVDEARRRMEEDPSTLIVDVRDAEGAPAHDARRPG